MAGQGESQDLWMVPFADLMSTLVILFMALYGYAVAKQLAERAKQQEKREAPQEELLAKELEVEVRKLLPEDVATLALLRDRLVLTLETPVVFDSGSDELKPAIRPFLDKLAGAIGRLPNEVLVAGHSDSVRIVGGRYRTNRELSAARAYRVIAYLAGRGLEPRRFTAWGYGEHRPLASNATRAERARNRRIEISLIRR